MTKRTDEAKRALYQQWQSSGMSGAAFSRQHQISTATLWQWRKIFGKQPQASALSVGLPSTLTPNPISATTSAHPEPQTEQHGVAEQLQFYPVNLTAALKSNAAVGEATTLGLLEVNLPNGIRYSGHLAEASLRSLLLELLK